MAAGIGLQDTGGRLNGMFRRRGATDRRRPPERGDRPKSFLLTLIAVLFLAAFLSPLLRSATFAFKSTEQISQPGSPVYPADPATFEYEGETLDVYNVPLDGATRQLALLKPGRTESQFVDPGDPSAPPIVWQGSWRTLEPAWTFAPQLSNFAEVWDLIDYPRLLFNTLALAIIGTIGTVLSCTLVAYGFARFRFPGRNLLFTLLIATIFLPYAVTIIPTYTLFVELGWVGTWLPLARPGVLRQRVRRVPHAPVLHDDPDRDGRGGGDRWSRSIPDPRVGAPSAGLAGGRRGGDLPPRLLVERLLRPVDLPVGAARSAAAGRRPVAVQRHPLPQPRADPGRYADDDDHPGRSRSCSPRASSRAASSSPASRSRAARRWLRSASR